MTNPTEAVDALRALGPEGLRRFLSAPGALASPLLDRLCAQRDARASLLYWYTDLGAAIARARRVGRPILSLQLLGRLDEELSCANSRFFRTTLYPDASVATLLREGFVLHWRTVRPVPRVRVDFGDGRFLERTITGNSAHLVLDVHGRPVDALPGLYSAEAFIKALAFSRAVERETRELSGSARRTALARHHRTARDRNVAAWAKALGMPRQTDPRVLEAATGDDWARLGGEVSIAPTQLLASKHPTAREAGSLAQTKMRVESPMLRALEPLNESIAADTAKNEHLLRRRVHERFARQEVGDEAVPFSEWVYEELFLMPSDDPYLGLAPDDAYAAIETPSPPWGRGSRRHQLS